MAPAHVHVCVMRAQEERVHPHLRASPGSCSDIKYSMYMREYKNKSSFRVTGLPVPRACAPPCPPTSQNTVI